jgi:hypothetical protein
MGGAAPPQAGMAGLFCILSGLIIKYMRARLLNFH